MILLFLHQTTTKPRKESYNGRLYIILFLHQTTTHGSRFFCSVSCISSYSYIKPQHIIVQSLIVRVVYHPIPTSNHNKDPLHVVNGVVVYHPIPTSNHNGLVLVSCAKPVVYHPIPTSNHNFQPRLRLLAVLYIILFLHQTTT